MEQRTEFLKRKKSKQTKHFVSKTFSRENYSKSLSKYCFYFSDFIKKKKSGLLSQERFIHRTVQNVEYFLILTSKK